MAEYIEREAAIRALLNDSPEQVSYSREDAADCVHYMDAADVAPARHGRWVEIKGMAPPEYHGKHRCSLCYARALERKMHEELSNYCPNCGAKMDLEE